VAKARSLSDAEIEPRKHEHRVHVSEHVRRQENATSDLEGAETIDRPDVGVRSEVHATADLKQEQRNQRRLGETPDDRRDASPS
jgi:hypothetical protein